VERWDTDKEYRKASSEGKKNKRIKGPKREREAALN
jgi:hypothetical protein